MTRKRWAVVLAVALAVTALAAVAASRLSIETRLVDLLPEGSPAAEDYRVFLDRFGGVERVYAVVTAARSGEAADETGVEPELLAEAADRLAARLAEIPEVAAARSGLSAEDEEFVLERLLPRAPLLAPDAGAVARRMEPEAIRERVRAIRERLRTPAGAATGALMAADPLGFAEALPGEASAPLTAGAGGAPVDPLTGAFLAADGSAALVVVTPAAGELDAEAGRALVSALERAAVAVEEALGGGFEVDAVGGPLYAAQDEAILKGDLIRTLSGSAVGVALLLALAFGGWREPVALVAAVVAGILWTGAAAVLALGAVSALGVGFASILLGLGVDYGIHGAARYRQRRLAGSGPEASASEVLRAIAPAILTSAATTGLGFAVLVLAHFRPVRELGVVVAAGVAAVLIATVAVAAPMLVLADRRGDGSREERPGWLWRGIGHAAGAAKAFGTRHPWVVLPVAGALTVAAVLALPRLGFDADLRALRPEDHPALAAEELLAEHFGVGLDSATLVVEGADLDQALGRAAEAAGALREAIAGDPASAVATVATAADWVPPQPVLARRARDRGGPPAAEAAETLRASLAEHGLAEKPFRPALAVLDAMAADEPPPPVPVEEWPEWLRLGVSAPVANGEEPGAAVAVRLSAPLGVWPEGPPPAVLAAGTEAAPGAAVASVPRLAAELKSLLAADFRRLGGWALAAVAVAVLLSFRGRPLPSLVALAPVSLGLLWTLGLCAALGVDLDPFSLLVAPILVGIGIDDGLHAVHGAVTTGGGGLGGLSRSVSAAGPAMTLTTLTTAVGFGGLALSRLPAFARGGLLVAGGTVLCLAATLFVLPALGTLGDRRASGRAR